MTTFLVTGGAGFIGSHLCDRLLAEGHGVVAIDDLSSGRLSNIAEARTYGGDRFAFSRIDIRAEGLGALFERHAPEVGMHLAAVSARPGNPCGPMEETSVGIQGLLAVLEQAARCEVRKVVFASSASVYGGARVVPTGEMAQAGAGPATPGTMSKRAAEDYLRFYRRARGVDFVSVVMPAVYGPRQDREGGLVATFLDAMLRKEHPEIFGDGEQTRDFLFVEDAVHALWLAADRGSGETVNVGTGVETSVNTACEMLIELTGFRGRPVFGPPRAGDIRRSALDASLAGTVLGWKPWTHLEDGLKETVAFVQTP